MTVLITLAAFLLDSLLGDPQSWPHPVRWIGRLVLFLEDLSFKALAVPGGRDRLHLLAGVVLGVLVVAVSGGAVWLSLAALEKISFFLWLLWALYLCFASFCFRDLVNHAGRVEKALSAGDLGEARQALSWIVGRDTGSLDDQAVRRALVETMAENFSDGVVAPLLYLALGGPVLAFCYKAVNTLDSMVGYKNERFLYLGRFSARLDDLVNYVPARLSALLLVLGARLSGLDWRRALTIWRRDGGRHSSPNSGQTEAAAAGALGVRLGGASSYGGALVDKPEIGAELGETTAGSVRDCVRLVRRSLHAALLLAFLVQAVILHFAGPFPWGWGLDYE
ncbi:MAG: adenosylcobinamide-phosphate synthase CbiB [Deltaproteobacteria bacterium]|nr:adenosylcobinamide-phosphate synthase CbiB [Deltaproteobacteria bacterium]